MAQQVLLQKEMNQVDFLTTTPYEKAVIPKSPRFVIRQGDLIVTNYILWNRRDTGMTYARPKQLKDNIFLFRDSHLVLVQREKATLVHNEHGIVEIPRDQYELHFYTFREAFD